MLSKQAIAASAAGLAALGALGIAQVATAAPTPTPTTSPTASASSAKPTAQPTATSTSAKRGGSEEAGIGRGVAAKALAQKLGLDEAKVKTALTATGQQLRTEAKAGTKPTEAEFVSVLAQQLGVDQARVQTAVDQLKAEAKAKRQEALKARLDQAVKDGKITQADEDSILKAAQAGVLGGHK